MLPLDPPDPAASRPDGTDVPHVPALPGTYVNPILDWDFPDPSVIRADDGFYYAYATHTLRDDQWINIQVARSADLFHWEHLCDVLPE